MLYLLGVIDLKEKKLKGNPYIFKRKAKSFSHNIEHVIISTNTIMGYINIEWGLKQQVVPIAGLFPYMEGSVVVLESEKDKFIDLVKTKLNSLNERFYLLAGKYSYIGFIQTAKVDINADNINKQGFSISFLVDGGIQNQTSIITELNEALKKDYSPTGKIKSFFKGPIS